MANKFVWSGATGVNDGSTWENAYTSRTMKIFVLFIRASRFDGNAVVVAEDKEHAQKLIDPEWLAKLGDIKYINIVDTFELKPGLVYKEDSYLVS